MNDNLILEVGSFILLIIFGYIIFDYIRDKPIKMKEKCTCGKEKKWCRSYLYSGGSTLLGRKRKWECGKFLEQYKQMSSSPSIKRIRKEIKEKGSSCPENW